MTDLSLQPLEGTNPIGFLAALGVLDALAKSVPDATLRWTDDLVPNAIISGACDFGTLVDVLDKDREAWADSALLRFPGSEPEPLPDAKPGEKQLREWFEFVRGPSGSLADMNHLCAIVAEGALDNNKRAKPTHLHFTAGQQQFLGMVRDLASSVDRERIIEATQGPWRYDSPLPSLSWDSRGERVYAVRAANPSKEKRLGVPGADWLAFRGLVFYPVMRSLNGTLRTTGCDPEWKSSAFRWPMWTVPVTRNVVRSLVADPTLVSKGAHLRGRDLCARGISSVLRAPIRRSDQGGYGSFGAPESLINSEE